MQFDRILVTTDFSDHSRAAFRIALSLARATNASIRLVHVLGGEAVLDETFGSWLSDQDTARLRKVLEGLCSRQLDVVCEPQLLHGNPAEQILKLAKEGHFDLIVMGTHGRSGMSRLMMGSVAETIVRRAECPVLTIRNSDQRLETAVVQSGPEAQAKPK